LEEPLLGDFFGGATTTNDTSEGNLPFVDVCGFFMSLLSEKEEILTIFCTY